MTYETFILLHPNIDITHIKSLLMDYKLSERIMEILIQEKYFFNEIGLIYDKAMEYYIPKLKIQDYIHMSLFTYGLYEAIKSFTYKIFMNKNFFDYYQKYSDGLRPFDSEEIYEMFIQNFSFWITFHSNATTNLLRVYHLMYITKIYLYKTPTFTDYYFNEIAILIYNNLKNPLLYELLEFIDKCL